MRCIENIYDNGIIIDGKSKCVHRETTIPLKNINKYIWKDYAKLKSSVLATSDSIDLIWRWVCLPCSRDYNTCYVVWMLYGGIYDSLFAHVMSRRRSIVWNSCEGISFHFNCKIIEPVLFLSFSSLLHTDASSSQSIRYPANGLHTKLNENILL